MNHDVIEDRYARLYEQPFQLSQLGNHVLGICLSYRPCEAKDEIHAGDNGNMRWVGFSSGNFRTSIPSYPGKLLKLAEKFKPDLIVASSDCLHIVLGRWLADKIGIQFSADLYDDYESFSLAKIPFLKHLYRKALRQAKVISCVSNNLANHIKAWCRETSTVVALPSTIDKQIFHAMDKKQIREQLNLPPNKIIVGTAGGLTAEKGIATVYQAILLCLEEKPDIHFAIAGSIDKNCPPPIHKQIHYLGRLAHHKVAELFCALDLGIIYLRDTSYGRLSFPQKAYEMAACKIPIVAADIGDMSTLFSRDRNELYTADDVADLAHSIKSQIASPSIPNLEIDDWQEHGKKLNQLYIDSLGTKKGFL
jgi:glycosyltransferase involved in cell wall biosynthesis